ncbi:ATPase [Halieaceae bacterium IMCC14734]|uniref:ATPase n=1 Tax=Candidatus Litorirhabdus singularis TaxID=2518993 RepID=A0ABT3TIF0_9GAMM|nr:permease [Candidatus Litorirhabdus singularis]MCX2981784.1 ATPase [Candidatus Litorirhabdus singularis]
MSDCCDTEKPAPAADDAATDHCSGHAAGPRKPDRFLWFCVSSVVVLYAIGLWLPHESLDPGRLSILSHGVIDLFNSMWWGMAIGVVFVGILGYIPRDLVMSVLGYAPGFSSLLRATVAGVFLDLCSHGILAVAMKLYERGASLGQVMAFLLASPWNSFSLTLILFGLIGVGWTLLFIALSLVIGLISGAIFDALVARGRLPENPHREFLNAEANAGLLWREFRASWQFSMAGSGRLLLEGVRGSRIVIRWGLFGILLASVIRMLVPEAVFATWFGATMTGLGLTILAATIIEVCSEGTTPVAADLMHRGSAPGNSFAFLMAGVATDYTEIMSIRDTTRSWKIALFLPLITLPQIIVLAIVLNQFPV